MPNLRDLRRRIRSIRNTQQLPRAMKMVAAAKLRKAQERNFAARPYAFKIREVLESLSLRVDPSRHPLLARPTEKRVEVLVITADKGLCGSFNTHIIRKAMEFLGEQQGKELSLFLVGRKSRDFFRRRDFKIRRQETDLFREVRFADAIRITGDLVDAFVSREVDAIYMIYNGFKSVLRQELTMQKLFPVGDLRPEEAPREEDYIYEPEDRVLFDRLLPKYVETQIYQALLESFSAEQAARMTAMGNATENAGEMIDQLTLSMNRVRQAVITREIIEVVSGVEAL
ncbi:MAG: ATP synthase F1 subunit gamma [Acidobacteriota bacterium]